MNIIQKNRKLIVGLFALLMLALGMSLTVHAAGPGSVIESSTDTISGGRWIRTSAGRMYRKSNGVYVRGTWARIKGNVYYFDNNGIVKTGLFRYNSKTYYASVDGVVAYSTWKTISNRRYYFTAKGHMAHFARWYTINGKKYYFARNGAYLVTNSWVGTRFVDEKGRKIGNATIDGRKVDKHGDIVAPAVTDRYIIVGASRIEDMSYCVNTNRTIFIASASQGLKWFREFALPKLESYLAANPKFKVVFQMGNNDRYHLDKYIEEYQRLIKRYPNTKFFFLDLTPGKYEAANQYRKSFNQKMKKVFGNKCIGGYDFVLNHLKSINYYMPDAIHYHAVTSQKLFSYIIRMIKDR